jgi:hypothetical protein
MENFCPPQDLYNAIKLRERLAMTNHITTSNSPT